LPALCADDHASGSHRLNTTAGTLPAELAAARQEEQQQRLPRKECGI
jgi:hypothetical protein